MHKSRLKDMHHKKHFKWKQPPSPILILPNLTWPKIEGFSAQQCTSSESANILFLSIAFMDIFFLFLLQTKFCLSVTKKPDQSDN